MRVFVLLVLVLFMCPTAVLAASVKGKPHIIDGDTLLIEGVNVRLHGIDAPELNQFCYTKRSEGLKWACGYAAAMAMHGKVGDREVRCEGVDYDSKNRMLATCYLEDTDLNAWIVSRGFAVAHREKSMKYTLVEDEAKASQAGLWSSNFKMPWLWRAENPECDCQKFCIAPN